MTSPSLRHVRTGAAIEPLAFVAGAAIVIFLAGALVGAALALVGRIAITVPALLAGTLASVAYVAYAVGQDPAIDRPRRAAVVASILAMDAAVSALLLQVGGAFFDLSWDGQSYHGEAIAQLAAGWNPFHVAYAGPWHLAQPLNFYSKGPWLLGAVFYDLHGSIEVAKGLNALLAAATFVIVLSELTAYCRTKVWTSIVLAVLVVLNPVVVTQFLGLYVDGQVALLLTLTVFVSLRAARGAGGAPLIVLAAIGILIINTKLTGLFYFVLLAAGFALWMVYADRRIPKRYVAAAGAAVVLGAGLVGFNPYVTSTLAQKWPEALKAPNVRGNSPPDLRDRPAIVKLARSLFAESDAAIQPSRIKVPFTYKQAELATMVYPDARTGGFGPLFGGAFILAAGLWALLLSSGLRERNLLRDPYWATAGIVLGTLLVFPEAWWARYAPQMWLLPLLAVIVAWGLPQRNIAVRGLSWLVVATMLVNAALVAAQYVPYQIHNSALMRRNLAILAKVDKPLEVNFRHEAVNAVRFASRGIRFVAKDKLACERPVLLTPVSVTALCVDAALAHELERAQP